ncbi:BTAD domain-containing putative transcriptional regulator [Streptomyces sp. NPDC059786]|uniref:BTAD domain-containing putative transcriptional regulator n=1 Tax=Streptomyces sp. NPDC059786 TaxID=3346946 RepID=UPI00365D3700
MGPLRHRALLGLLLVRLGNVVTAGQLVDELWGTRPPRQPVATLQTYVSHLRRALARAEERGGGHARLRYRAPGYVFELDPELVDAYRFERLLERGRRHIADRRFDRARDDLTRALSLWDAQPYHELVSYGPIAHENERLGQLRLTALEAQADACLALGDADWVVRALYPEVQHNPTRERLVGHLMTGLYHLGRQAEALRLYEQTRLHLAEELGVDPGGELQRVHADILRQRLDLLRSPVRLVGGGAGEEGTDGGEPPTGTDAPGRPMEPPAAEPVPPGDMDLLEDTDGADPVASAVAPVASAPGTGLRAAPHDILAAADPISGTAPAAPGGLTPGAGRRARGLFVGRGRESALLGAHVLDALNGGSHLTAVLGEMGVGKTELVEEVAADLNDLLQEVVWGCCTSGEGVPAYWVWSQVFRQLAVSRPEAFRRAEARFGSLLAPLMLDPEAGRRSLTAEDPPTLARFLIQDAMCETLLALAAEEPLVVVLEDLDQADERSLELLGLLRTRLHGEPLGVVLIAEDTGVAADFMKGGAVTDILSDPRTRTLRLTGLSPGETADLVGVRTGARVPDDVLRVLHERSRGNPYFLHEFLAGVGDPRYLRDRTTTEAALVDVPLGVRQALGRRIAALPEGVVEVLRCCAALGAHFDLGLVRDVVPPDTDPEPALEAAARCGLLRKEPRPPFRLAFRETLIQEVLLAELSSTERTRLRASALRAVLQKPGPVITERDQTRRPPRRTSPGCTDTPDTGRPTRSEGWSDLVSTPPRTA